MCPFFLVLVFITPLHAQSCFRNDTCDSCVQSNGSDCAWCSPEGAAPFCTEVRTSGSTCPLSAFLIPPRGQCSYVPFQRGCQTYSTCEECVAGSGCGWFGNSNRLGQQCLPLNAYNTSVDMWYPVCGSSDYRHFYIYMVFSPALVILVCIVVVACRRKKRESLDFRHGSDLIVIR